MIGIIDYGVGNIQAFLNLLKRLDISAKRVTTPSELNDCSRIILPGVGHFDHAMHKLNNSGFLPILNELVILNKIPVIGICVGMQMLSESSEEGNLPGLGWIPGKVRSMKDNPNFVNLRLPHMGWNTIDVNKNSLLFSDGFDDQPQFYFLHSYYFEAYDREDVVATVNYGVDFDAVISRENIHGVQCHPEKSHHWGEQLIKNFCR
jgi:imidazole glycerol-phosphate synthase subunit HisH